ncbi:hypothetical protein GGI22_003946 [Coemansia erecta]|nr:hypothetical protein GGI22_003946 [Coemansia erecta]
MVMEPLDASSIRSASPEMPVLVIPHAVSAADSSSFDSSARKLESVMARAESSSRGIGPMPPYSDQDSGQNAQPRDGASVSGSGPDSDGHALEESDESDDQSSIDSASAAGNDLMAQLDQFDKELDEALRS